MVPWRTHDEECVSCERPLYSNQIGDDMICGGCHGPMCNDCATPQCPICKKNNDDSDAVLCDYCEKVDSCNGCSSMVFYCKEHLEEHQKGCNPASGRKKVLTIYGDTEIFERRLQQIQRENIKKSKQENLKKKRKKTPKSIKQISGEEQGKPTKKKRIRTSKSGM